MGTKLFNERPKWQQYFLIIVTFTIAFSLVSCVENVKQRYEEAMPGTRMEYLNLYFYASLKKRVIGFGVSPESAVIKQLDQWGEDNYQAGLANMPEGIGERYIWYYLRYLAPYVVKYNTGRLPEGERLTPDSLVIFSSYFNAPLQNPIWQTSTFRYEIGTVLLGRFILSPAFAQTQDEESLRKFMDVFSYSVKLLIASNKRLEDAHVKYYMMGSMIAERALFTSHNVTCDMHFIQQYLYIKNMKKVFLHAASAKMQKSYGIMMAGIPKSVLEKNANSTNTCTYQGEE